LVIGTVTADIARKRYLVLSAAIRLRNDFGSRRLAQINKGVMRKVAKAAGHGC
jgi:hypothetical protein